MRQSWEQRQLTRWDKYGKWGKAWHKRFPIQENTPQCISSRHLTQSSPSLPHPKASSRTTPLFVPNPVCVREEAGDEAEEEKTRIICTFVCLPKHTPTHTHTKSLKCWCHLFWPHHHFAYCGNLPRVNWLGLSWFFCFVLFCLVLCFSQGMVSIHFNTGIECYCVRHRAFQFNRLFHLEGFVFCLFLMWLPHSCSLQYPRNGSEVPGHLPRGEGGWGGREGSLPGPTGKPFLDVPGRMCGWHEASSNWGTPSPKSKVGGAPAFYRFFSHLPASLGSTLLLHGGRGPGSGQDDCSPPGQWGGGGRVPRSRQR